MNILIKKILKSFNNDDLLIMMQKLLYEKNFLFIYGYEFLEILGGV